VQAVELLFHAGAALALGLMAWRDRARPAAPRPLAGRRLAAYLAGYAALRFVLEWQRENPPLPPLGLTWYQLLAAALFALAAGTWLARARAARRDCRAASALHDRRA
jgi:prolipoprotein diacylglyceryltransferase